MDNIKVIGFSAFSEGIYTVTKNISKLFKLCVAQRGVLVLFIVETGRYHMGSISGGSPH